MPEQQWTLIRVDVELQPNALQPRPLLEMVKCEQGGQAQDGTANPLSKQSPSHSGRLAGAAAGPDPANLCQSTAHIFGQLRADNAEQCLPFARPHRACWNRVPRSPASDSSCSTPLFLSISLHDRAFSPFLQIGLRSSAGQALPWRDPKDGAAWLQLPPSKVLSVSPARQKRC
jgi:hypothetical protein